MILKRTPGVAGFFEEPQLRLELGTVAEVLDWCEAQWGESFSALRARCSISVNGRSIAFLQGFETRLEAEDVVRVLSLAGGG